MSEEMSEEKTINVEINKHLSKQENQKVKPL